MFKHEWRSFGLLSFQTGESKLVPGSSGPLSSGAQALLFYPPDSFSFTKVSVSQWVKSRFVAFLSEFGSFSSCSQDGLILMRVSLPIYRQLWAFGGSDMELPHMRHISIWLWFIKGKLLKHVRTHTFISPYIFWRTPFLGFGRTFLNETPGPYQTTVTLCVLAYLQQKLSLFLITEQSLIDSWCCNDSDDKSN